MSKQNTKKEDRSVFRFDSALTELEGMVEQLESGQLGLEVAMDVFEKSVNLTRNCQQALDKAQQRVETLIEQHGLTTSESEHAEEGEGDDEDYEDDEDEVE
ncbi:MAG: exodeoxyribonuclease VII small subunit [Gammaproteobacteria bacterium]